MGGIDFTWFAVFKGMSVLLHCGTCPSVCLVLEQSILIFCVLIFCVLIFQGGENLFAWVGVCMGAGVCCLGETILGFTDEEDFVDEEAKLQ